MKKLSFFCLLLLVLRGDTMAGQSLIDSDSIIVIQNDDSTFTALAVTIYAGLKAKTIKQIYRDRYSKSQRLKVEASKQTILLEEQAKKASETYFQVTGDTIAVDSVSLDGDWALKGGETTPINFSITNGKSTNNRIKVKILDEDEIFVTIKDIGELSFFKEDGKTWIGKTKDVVYRITRRRAAVKANTK